MAKSVACVAWRFLSGETAITNPKVARSLGERQLISPLHSRSKNSLNRQATQATKSVKKHSFQWSTAARTARFSFLKTRRWSYCAASSQQL